MFKTKTNTEKVHFTGASQRIRPEDYVEYRQTVQRYVDGKLSADEAEEIMERFGRTPYKFHNDGEFLKTWRDAPAYTEKTDADYKNELTALQKEYEDSCIAQQQMQRKAYECELPLIKKQLNRDAQEASKKCRAVHARLQNLGDEQNKHKWEGKFRQRNAWIFVAVPESEQWIKSSADIVNFIEKPQRKSRINAKP